MKTGWQYYRVYKHGGNIKCVNRVAIYRACEHGCNIECEQSGNIECEQGGNI